MTPRIPSRVVFPTLLALAALLRFMWPLADPGARLSWSNGLYTDPATVTHAARNRALFGEWIRDESRDVVFYPLHNALTWIAFEGLGVRRLTTQLLAALLGVLTVAAIAWAVRRCAGGTASVLTALLVGTCFWIVMFSRVPIAENVTVLLLALASGLAVGRSAAAHAAAGSLAGVAALFGKLHAVAYVPALLLFLVMRERRVRALTWPLAGLATAAASWTAVIWVPHHDAVRAQLAGASASYGAIPFLESPLRGAREFLVAIDNSWLFYRLPVLSILGLVFALVTAASARARRERLADGRALFVLWFASVGVYCSIIPYQAPRYYLLAVVPLVACAAMQLEALLRDGNVRVSAPRAAQIPWWALGVFLGGYAGAVSFSHWIALWHERIVPHSSRGATAFRELLRSIAEPIDRTGTLAWIGLACVVLWAAGARLLFSPAGAGLRRRIARVSRARLAKQALLVALVLNAWQLADWAARRTYVIEETKRSLAAALGEGAVVLGSFAPLLAQDTKHTVVPQFGVVSPETVERHGVTHVLVTEAGPPAEFREMDAAVSARLRPVHAWSFRTRLVRMVRLFRVPRDGYVESDLERAADAVRAGRHAEALALFEEVAAASPGIPDPYSLAAEVYYLDGRPDLARRSLERAVAIRPGPTDLYNLGRLLLSEGDREGARSLWLQGLALDPFDPALDHGAAQLADR